MKEVDFDHEGVLLSGVYDLFCMEYKPKYDIFAFDDECEDFLHASNLASISSSPYQTEEPSTSMLKLKPSLIPSNMHSWICMIFFPIISVNDLNPNQETQVLDWLREIKNDFRADLKRHKRH